MVAILHGGHVSRVVGARVIQLGHAVHGTALVARHLPLSALPSRHGRPERPEGDRERDEEAQYGSSKTQRGGPPTSTNDGYHADVNTRF